LQTDIIIQTAISGPADAISSAVCRLQYSALSDNICFSYRHLCFISAMLVNRGTASRVFCASEAEHHFANICLLFLLQTFAGQDEFMEELLGDEYYVDLFAQIADSEPITEAIDEVTLSSSSCAFPLHLPPCPPDPVSSFTPPSSFRYQGGRPQDCKHEKYIVGSHVGSCGYCN